MQPTPWSSSQIKQCEQQAGEAMLSDEHSLFFYSEDFGKLQSIKPAAVIQPTSLAALQSILRYANHQSLPAVIRGKGLSQGGQALPVSGGITIQLDHFNRVSFVEDNLVWAEANASWADVLSRTLEQQLAPYIVPYNTQLSVGGVISAGGVGAASFKYGSVVRHVEALEVVTADGAVQLVDKSSELFHACLAGQGRFGVITRACIQLRPCKKQVRTFMLLYLDKDQWLQDIQAATTLADSIEAFCSPAMMGARLTDTGRLPFAEWLYVLHVTLEYEDQPPEFDQLSAELSPWKLLHCQDEPIASYYYRHDPRFKAMKLMGQWELPHPWYECFVPKTVLTDSLEGILSALPLYYANVLQVSPIDVSAGAGFFKMPDEVPFFGVMILTPGVISALLPSCLATIDALDKRFLKAGGKRYLSGYLGQGLPNEYWEKHYGADYERWMRLKQEYDPNRVFQSSLYP